MEPLGSWSGVRRGAARPRLPARAGRACCATSWAGPRRSPTPSASRSASAGASTSSARTCATPARTRSTTRWARPCSPSAWARRASIAETGAGQHGVATATVCALLRPRVRGLHGRGGHARARRSTSSACSCSAPRCAPVDVRRAHPQGRHQRGHARLGHQRPRPPTTCSAPCSAPHPYPDHGARLPAVIGQEARAADAWSARARCPTRIVACVGGGSQRHRHLPPLPRTTQREADRRRGRRARRCRRRARRPLAAAARLGVLHGTRTYVLQDDDGQDRADALGLGRPGLRRRRPRARLAARPGPRRVRPRHRRRGPGRLPRAVARRRHHSRARVRARRWPSAAGGARLRGRRWCSSTSPDAATRTSHRAEPAEGSAK